MRQSFLSRVPPFLSNEFIIWSRRYLVDSIMLAHTFIFFPPLVHFRKFLSVYSLPGCSPLRDAIDVRPGFQRANWWWERKTWFSTSTASPARLAVFLCRKAIILEWGTAWWVADFPPRRHSLTFSRRANLMINSSPSRYIVIRTTSISVVTILIAAI